MKSFYGWLFNKSKVMIALLVTLVVLGAFYFTQMPKRSEPDLDVPITFIEMSFKGTEYASISDLNEVVVEQKEKEIRQVSKLININTTIYNNTFDACKDVDIITTITADKADMNSVTTLINTINKNNYDAIVVGLHNYSRRPASVS